MTATSQRTDVAYVGQLSGTTFMAVAINRANPTAFYTMCRYNTTIYFTRGYIGTNLSDINSVYSLLYLQWNPSNSTMTLLNQSGTLFGYLNIASNGYLVVNADQGAQLILTTTDPVGYGDGLLAGARYALSTSTLDSSGIITNVNNGLLIESGNYAGLYTDNPSSGAIGMQDLLWSFIPVNVTYLGTNKAVTTPSTVPSSLAISQCISLQGTTGYGSSSTCSNWAGSTGFSTPVDAKSIIYFYSQNGTCGEDYTFTNDFIGNTVDVGSSIGDCAVNSSCNYSSASKIFSCGAPVVDDDNPDDPDDPVDPDAGRDGILTKWWFWGLLLLVVGILIIIVIIAIVAASSKKKKAAAEVVDESGQAVNM